MIVCRLCLKPAYERIDVRHNVRKVLKLHFGFEISADDPVSNIICNVCWIKTSNFNKFYNSVEKAQRTLSNGPDQQLVKLANNDCSEKSYNMDTYENKTKKYYEDQRQSELIATDPKLRGQARIRLSKLKARDLIAQELLEESSVMLHCCDVCDKEYTSADILARHKAKRHKTYHCNLCPKTYNDSEELEQHQQRHKLRSANEASAIRTTEQEKELALQQLARLQQTRRKAVQANNYEQQPAESQSYNQSVSLNLEQQCNGMVQPQQPEQQPQEQVQNGYAEQPMVSLNSIMQNIQQEKDLLVQWHKQEEEMPVVQQQQQHLTQIPQLLQEQQQVPIISSPLLRAHACQKCPKRFATAEELVEHEVQHVSYYHCYLCPARFRENHALHEHLRCEHSLADVSINMLDTYALGLAVERE